MNSHLLLDTPEILKLLFQPPQEQDTDTSRTSQDVELTVAQGIVLCCRWYFAAADAPTLLYFPGGNASLAGFESEGENYVRNGVNVFLASYRGYGRSAGTPSVSDMLRDGRSLLPLVADWLAGNGCSEPLFVMGRGIGSVCAIDLVHNQAESVKGLIIESGFCETASLLQALGAPLSAIPPAEGDGFDNLRKLAEIKLPTLIFHGARDVLIPVAQAEKLQAVSGARNKQFFIVPGAAHDTVGKTGGTFYYQKIREFLDSVCGRNTWRQRRREFKSGRTGESA